MVTEAESIYWKECWPMALRNVIKSFMEAGDTGRMAGLLSLATCHRKATDYEAAVVVLIRQILQGFDEAKEIREELAVDGMKLKEEGLYNAREELAKILEEGLVLTRRLAREVQGYRKPARDIYLELKNAGFLKTEERKLGRSKVECVGLNAKWGSFVEDIRNKGVSKDMWASSAGVMLCTALTSKGITKILPMALGVLEADKEDGKITYEKLLEHSYVRAHHGKKELDIILERQREKIDFLKIFPSDTGALLIVNPNTVKAVKAWRTEANRLARARGLGV